MKKFTLIFILFLLIPLANATHDDFAGRKHPNEGSYDLNAISYSGKFGIDPIGSAFNVEAFREGEGHVIRSRPYYWGSRSAYPTYHYSKPAHDYIPGYQSRVYIAGDGIHSGCFNCVRYGIGPYNGDSYKVRTYEGYSNNFYLTEGKYPTYEYNRGFKSHTIIDKRWNPYGY
jgi:hypothetical protein